MNLTPLTVWTFIFFAIIAGIWGLPLRPSIAISIILAIFYCSLMNNRKY